MIVNGSGHLSAVNSLALQLAGVTRDTPDPVGGHFVRDEHGEATGVLHETAQEPIQAAAFPRLRSTTRSRRCGAATTPTSRAGITSSQDAGSASADDMCRRISSAVKRGQLKLRTSMMIRENLLPHIVELGIKQGFGAATGCGSGRSRCSSTAR